MTNVEDLQKEELESLEEKVEIEVEEVPLEDLLILGTDKLINIGITYPEEKDGEIIIVKTKAKIKQLSIKRLKNLNLDKLNLETVVRILEKALFTQKETAFTRDLILELPVGVCFAITKEIMRISGVDENQLGF